MITGFNTDVEYEGVVYHVQTEDKGVETPLILSLVYNRGTILASKRSPYEDLVKGDALNEKVLAERLQKQHKLICAAIRGGRLEDLKRMTMKDSEARKAESGASKIVSENEAAAKVEEAKTKAAQSEPIEIKKTQPPAIPQPSSAPEKIITVPDKVVPDKPATAPLPPVMRTSDRIGQKLAEKIDNAKSGFLSPRPADRKSLTDDLPGDFRTESHPTSIPKPQPAPWQEIPQTVPRPIEAEPIFEAFEIIDEEMILPAEAVAVVEEFSSLEALNSKHLEIGFLNETEFKGGDRKTVSIIIWRGHRENGIAHAQVMVKILGSSFRPMIFHSQTDTNGVATVHLQLPHFRAGRAAILVRALTNGEEIEMRRVITHG